MIVNTAKRFGFIAWLFIATGLCFQSAYADTKLLTNPEVQQFINNMVKNYSFSPSYLQKIFQQTQYQSEIIKKMTTPKEGLPWYRYRELFIKPETIEGGLKFWKQNEKYLAKAEKEYGVPANIIVAIVGVETLYGKELGKFRAIDALATLAFYYPARAPYFRKELQNFLILMRKANLDPLKIPGSYAGALGYCQFMPSSYLAYAIDSSNEGKPNLFNEHGDVVFSVGNYLQKNGWIFDQPIATSAKIFQVFGKGYRGVVKSSSRKIQDPTLSLAQLHKHGVATLQSQPMNLKANFMIFSGKSKPEYWVGFHNFYVITRYNNSDLYAMAVYQLSTELSARWQKQI